MDAITKRTPNLIRSTLKFLGIFIIIEAALIAVVYLIGRRSGWDTITQYIEGLQIAGMLIIGVGFFGIKGNWDATRNFGYQYSMTASEQSSFQRTQQTLLDFAQAFRFLLTMLFIGGVNILVGFLF